MIEVPEGCTKLLAGERFVAPSLPTAIV